MNLVREIIGFVNANVNVKIYFPPTLCRHPPSSFSGYRPPTLSDPTHTFLHHRSPTPHAWLSRSHKPVLLSGDDGRITPQRPSSARPHPRPRY